MKMVVLASLLAVAGTAPSARSSAAQAAAGGGVQMQADEYAKYQACGNGQPPSATQAAACQEYLKAYPNSAVKKDVLQQIMFGYSTSNDAKSTMAAADAVLANDPNNLAAYVFEAQLHSASGDPAGAADYAKKGLALGQPAGMPDAQYQNIKTNGYPVLYSAEANGAAAAGDQAAAIAAFKQELAAVPVAQTTAPGLQLQDTYGLAQAYYKSSPPDLLNCAFYGARGMDYAPDPYKTTFGQLAKYCYQKFHGSTEGFEAVSASAKDNLNPPDGFLAGIKPAPKPEDIVAQLLSTTPDLATLAPGDREYVLQNGTTEQQGKVFDAVKGKVAKFPDILVISATADKVMTAVSDDAVQSKTADFEWDMKTPLKTVPAAGAKVTLVGTYSSYASSPIAVVMTDASVETKAPVKAAPAHRPVPRKR